MHTHKYIRTLTPTRTHIYTYTQTHIHTHRNSQIWTHKEAERKKTCSLKSV
uniref:Uncharacterized protein n=1 Tax=Anguilla anguilla TaxID=7936 RepID=A0A0E9TI59_ANGAN